MWSSKQSKYMMQTNTIKILNNWKILSKFYKPLREARLINKQNNLYNYLDVSFFTLKITLLQN